VNRFIRPLLTLPRSGKRGLAIGLDALLCAITVWLAVCLRLESWGVLLGNQWLAVGLSVALALPIFWIAGMYHTLFRYVSLPAFITVVKATICYGVLYAAALTALALPGVPRILGLLQPILLLLAVGASRLAVRYWLNGGYLSVIQRGALRKVLIYGAGSAGHQLAGALAHNAEMRAVGFLDDDERLHGHVMNGLPIYSPDDLKHLTERLQVNTVLLAVPSASRQRRNEVLEQIRHAGVAVRTLPGLVDLAQGRVQISDLRELDIEDLLGRDAVPPDTVLLSKKIHNKVVLVTGAGGSIGSELCRQILQFKPSKLLLIELNEFALYTVHQSLVKVLIQNDWSDVRLLPLLASVCDKDRMTEIMRTWQPHIVYHAAAYKHVPMVEHNPGEGIKNNVLGTWTTAKVAVKNGVHDFVLVSTDKAVRPTNVMGASKRLAEMLLQAMAAASFERGWKTRFSMVRFGNVLGSSGSVVPQFRKQIKDGVQQPLEPRRDSRRLPIMRGWGHGKSQAVLAGSEGTSGTDGPGAGGTARVAVGGDPVDRG
jgi:FlaA1/EpsC-like NDP-sugar epimerase